MRAWNVRKIASVHLFVSLGTEHGLSTVNCLRGSAISVKNLRDPFCEMAALESLPCDVMAENGFPFPKSGSRMRSVPSTTAPWVLASRAGDTA